MTNYRQSMNQTLDLMYLMREAKILERELTDKELKRREEIAKDLPDDEFKDRYGKDWMSVKMATATKMAKAEELEMDDEEDEEDEEDDEEEGLIRPGGLREKSDVSLAKKAKASGMPAGILKKVYKRGVAAWRTGHRPGTNPQQWGNARVNSFISKSKGTWGGADKDLAQQVRGKKEEFELDEGKMQDLWQKKNAKSLSVGPFELLRGKSGVHTIKRSGKVIGDFSYDSDADNFVANIKGVKGQFTGNDIDSLFTHLQKVHKEEVELGESVIDKVKEIASKKSAKKIDGVMVDSFTASAISQIYDKVNDANKKKMEKLPITKLANLAMKMMQKNEFVPEEVELDEDGHTDVSSAVRKCMTITEDAQDISSKLRTMSPEDSLPSWWTNKLAVASNSMNKMRDYIVNPLGEALDKKDEPTVKRIVGKLKKASQAHAGQAKDLEKAMDEDAVETAKDKIAKEKETDKKKHDKMMDRARIQQARQTNMATEEVEIDEAIAMTDEDLTNMYHATIKMMKRGMSQKQALNKQAKDVGATRKDTAKVKKMLDKAGFKEEVDMKTVSSMMEQSARADARRAMRRDPEMKQKGFSKDISATDDDKKAASKNIMVQMRKAQSLRGKFEVEFADGKKVRIPEKVAIAVQQKFNAMRKPSDKEKFQAKVAKSYKDMLRALKEGFASDAQRRAAFAQGYKAKGKKDKKESVLDRIDSKLKEIKNG